ncbi:MAG: hypothetical protein JWQ02_1466 [Capsulimonas sp.]|jgi:hypothetical protein|nr:hypothetical protein [Capsulimonas sp.]
MFQWLSRLFQKSEGCSLHNDLSAEERQAEASRYGDLLMDAVGAAIEVTRQTDPLLHHIMTQSTAADVLIGMEEMSAAYVVLPRTLKPGLRTIGLTWDWIDAHDQATTVEYILSEVREAIARGDLPDSPDEYLPAEEE